MGENSKIEWCDHTWNPWIGCTRVSAGCRHCYAEGVGRRLAVKWGPGRPRRRAAASTWRTPFAWNRRAAREGRRYRVFCASLADVFDPEVPDDWRDEAFATMALTPHLDWCVLTKRADAMRKYLTGYNEVRTVRGFIGRAARKLDPSFPILTWPLPNVWLGVSAENQAAADERVPILLDTPAAKRFVSCEPLLGLVDLECVPRPDTWPTPTDNISDGIDGLRYLSGPHLDWVICGGESGPRARPMHPDWARDLRDQCIGAGVPFFFKQWGEWAPGECCQPPRGAEWTADLINDEWHLDLMSQNALKEGHIDDEPDLYRVGKARADRVLDGRTHDEVPG